MADKPLWTQYDVRLDFTTELCGSVPGDPDLIKKWLEARKPRVRPPGGKSIDEINAEVLASLDEEPIEVSILVFQHDNENGGHIVTRPNTLRSHMKDCARVISTYYTGKVEGEKSLAAKIKNCAYLDDSLYWITILRPDGTKILEPDGAITKPIHVTDARGRPMNALKKFEYIRPARIDFTLKILGGVVSLKDLNTLFMVGGTHGYAGERSAGMGKYTFEIKEREDG